MKQLIIVCVAAVLVFSAASAGVVVENEVTIVDDSVTTTDSETFYAQGEMVRINPHSALGGADMSVIFRDQVMWFVNHDKKVCQKIDKAGMAELSAQIDQMLKQFEQMPPEQREMMQKMMQGKMPGMEPPPSRRVEVGATEQVGEYTCIVHTLYVDEDKTQEVCSADESIAADVTEAMGAFRALSEFSEDLQKVVRQGPVTMIMNSPYAAVDDMGGFPVRTRFFDGEGMVTYESTLKSITRQEIEETVFTVPKGYKVKDLSDEIRKAQKR